jgi:xanthine dehydrogenase YagS FAD-binding subunit
MVPNFSYVRPDTLAEAIRHLGAPGAKVHGGGTDLLGCLRDRIQEVRTVVSLTRLAELRGIAEAGGELRIGALTTIAEVARHPLVNERCAALAQAAASVGSPQLRNQGTIGGNLCQRPRCWYFRGDFRCARKGGDTCYAMGGENQYHGIFGGSACLIVHPSDTATALVALGARVSMTGPRGTRTVPLESFFVLPEQDVTKENVLEPNEILTEVLVPAAPADFVSAYRKVRARGAWDFALAGLAVALSFKQGRVDTARVVLGAAAPIPWRAKDAEKLLVGSRLDPRTIGLVAAAAIKNAAPLEQNGYKLAMFRGLVPEVLEGLVPTPRKATEGAASTTTFS